MALKVRKRRCWGSEDVDDNAEKQRREGDMKVGISFETNGTKRKR